VTGNSSSDGSNFQGSGIISDSSVSSAGATSPSNGCGMDAGIGRGVEDLHDFHRCFKFAIKSKSINAAKVTGIAMIVV
jgi:hypothetical protein